MEFRAICEAWTERRQMDAKRDISLAYYIAALASTAMFGEKGAFKPLWHYLGDGPPKKTAAQQKAEMETFADMWGLKMRPANKNIKVVYPKRAA